ncbi:uncharacterized protein LOC135400718 isoform X2 [Ornithodoros turicata]
MFGTIVVANAGPDSSTDHLLDDTALPSQHRLSSRRLQQGPRLAFTTRTIDLEHGRQNPRAPGRFTSHAPHDKDERPGDVVFNKLNKRRIPVKPESGRTPPTPVRREKCDSDYDCRRTPSQICVRRAHESYGRCQCPFYRPVEISINDRTRCVTAKDIFDECRTTEECAATDKNLQCINYLCLCTSPYALGEDGNCILGSGMQGKRYQPFLQGASAFIVLSLASGALVFITRKFKKKRRDSESSDTSSSLSSTRRMSSVLSPIPRASSLAQHLPVPRGSVLKNVRLPAFAQEHMKYIYNRSGSMSVPSSSTTVERSTDKPAPSQPQEHMKTLWGMQKFRNMASPLFQNKLIQSFRKGPPQADEEASRSVPIEEKPGQLKASMKPRQAPVQRPTTQSSEFPTYSIDTALSSMLQSSSARPQRSRFSSAPYRSEDMTSYTSYKFSHEATVDEDRSARPVQDVQQVSRSRSRHEEKEGFHLEDDHGRTRKKVSFARH